jgi:hypothetical protein
MALVASKKSKWQNIPCKMKTKYFLQLLVEFLLEYFKSAALSASPKEIIREE